MTFKQKVAGSLANSFLLRPGKSLHEQYSKDWQMGGSFVRKLMANVYLILQDYSTGEFPPRHSSREATFTQEREQFASYEFQSLEESLKEVRSKPFNARIYMLKHYLWAFTLGVTMIESKGLKPGARLLELGCGSGWLSELYAQRGYSVVGTTIAPVDIENAKTRIVAMKSGGLDAKLDFVCSPMEEVDQRVDHKVPFDVAFCFEALHHTFDWRESLSAAGRCLRPGGYLMLFSEPPTLHTYICYRSSKILKTQEIGFKPREIKAHLKSMGYEDIEIRRPVPIARVRDVWRQFTPIILENGSLMPRALWISARKPQ